MKCVRAIAILAALTQGQMSATWEELDELGRLQLVATLDPVALRSLGKLRDLWARHGAGAGPDAIWTRTWLQRALAELEARLRSDFHRTVTSDAKLAMQEMERAEMRGALGLLSDPEARAQAQHTAATLANLISPNARMTPCPPEPAPLYAVTRLGEAVLFMGQPRLPRYGALPIAELARSVRKADSKMGALTEQVRTIDAGLGFVRKGRHQVVAGLIKSGLDAQQAVAAYQQAQQYTRRPDAHPAEPPHLAVTLVRHACDTKNPVVAEQRMRAAEGALLRRGLPSGPQTRGAAKSLLGFPDLEAAASRFVDLCRALGPIAGADPSLLRYAARLMPVQAAPVQLAQRCQAVAASLVHGGFHRLIHVDATTVALAAMARDDGSVQAVVARFLEIWQLLRQEQQWMSGTTLAQGAVELTACPGTPQEAVATARALAAQLSAGGRAAHEAFDLACSLSKRVAF